MRALTKKCDRQKHGRTDVAGDKKEQYPKICVMCFAQFYTDINSLYSIRNLQKSWKMGNKIIQLESRGLFDSAGISEHLACQHFSYRGIDYGSSFERT